MCSVLFWKGDDLQSFLAYSQKALGRQAFRRREAVRGREAMKFYETVLYDGFYVAHRDNHIQPPRIRKSKEYHYTKAAVDNGWIGDNKGKIPFTNLMTASTATAWWTLISRMQCYLTNGAIIKQVSPNIGDTSQKILVWNYRPIICSAHRSDH